MGEMPNYVRKIVLEKLGNLWALREDRQRIKRRLGALQNLSLMKENIKNELKNIKNDLSSSRPAVEGDVEKILVENCNGDCANADESEGKNTHFTHYYITHHYCILLIIIYDGRGTEEKCFS
jgi:hypothetical protein